MPRVPMLDGPSVSPNALPFTPVSDAGSMQAAQNVGRDSANLGEGISRAANTLTDIEVNLKHQADQVQINDATNKARQAALDLTFNPQTGYKSLRGAAALNRPNDQALSDEYSDKLKTQIQDISAGLGNDTQRRVFAAQSNDMLTTFRGDVQAHTATEFRSHDASVQDGTIKLGVDTAKLYWNNPDKIGPAVDSASAAVVRLGQINGEAATETAFKLKTTTSAIHTGVIQAALENNNPEYAISYLNKNKDGMTADDLLRVRGVVNKDMYARFADGIATNTVSAFRAKVQPSDSQRMVDITRQTESGGNRDAVGKFIPGQGTAKGDMQVMDATATNPGHGITPEDVNVPGDRSRVGTQLLGALVTKYAGDPAKAWAAYNAGEGNVDKAIADAKGGNWMDALAKYQSADNHKQTVNYVTKNMTALQSGSGGPPPPTLQDVHDQIRAKVVAQFGTTPPPEVLHGALQAATKQWEDMHKSIAAQSDQVVAQAQRELITNGGDFTKLSPTTMAAVSQYAPGRMDDLALFAKRVHAPDRDTNMAAYNMAVTNPEKLAQMSDVDFLHFQKTLFSPEDQEKIARVRANEINSDTDNSTGSINTKAFNTSFNYRAEAMGLAVPKASDPTEVKAHFGLLQKVARDSINTAQVQAGRKFTPQELTEHLDTLFAKNVDFRKTFLGVGVGTSQQPLMSLTPSDIPDASRRQIAASFAKRGVQKPSESDVLEAYIKWKSNAK